MSLHQRKFKYTLSKLKDHLFEGPYGGTGWSKAVNQSMNRIASAGSTVFKNSLITQDVFNDEDEYGEGLVRIPGTTANGHRLYATPSTHTIYQIKEAGEVKNGKFPVSGVHPVFCEDQSGSIFHFVGYVDNRNTHSPNFVILTSDKCYDVDITMAITELNWGAGQVANDQANLPLRRTDLFDGFDSLLKNAESAQECAQKASSRAKVAMDAANEAAKNNPTVEQAKAAANQAKTHYEESEAQLDCIIKAVDEAKFAYNAVSTVAASTGRVVDQTLSPKQIKAYGKILKEASATAESAKNIALAAQENAETQAGLATEWTKSPKPDVAEVIKDIEVNTKTAQTHAEEASKHKKDVSRAVQDKNIANAEKSFSLLEHSVSETKHAANSAIQGVNSIVNEALDIDLESDKLKLKREIKALKKLTKNGTDKKGAKIQMHYKESNLAVRCATDDLKKATDEIKALENVMHIPDDGIRVINGYSRLQNDKIETIE